MRTTTKIYERGFAIATKIAADNGLTERERRLVAVGVIVGATDMLSRVVDFAEVQTEAVNRLGDMPEPIGIKAMGMDF